MELIQLIAVNKWLRTAMTFLLLLGLLAAAIDLFAIVLLADLISYFLTGKRSDENLISTLFDLNPFSIEANSLARDIVITLFALIASYSLKIILLFAENFYVQRVRKYLIGTLLTNFSRTSLDVSKSITFDDLFNLVIPRVNFVVANFLRPLLKCILTIQQGMIIFIGLQFLSPMILILVTLIAVLFFICYLGLKSKNKLAGLSVDKQTGKLIEIVGITKNLFAQIKINRLENKLWQRSESVLEQLSNALAYVQIYKAIPRLFLEAFLSILLVSTFLYIALSPTSTESSIDSSVLVACLLGLQRLMPSVGAINQFLSGRLASKIPIAEIMAALRLPRNNDENLRSYSDFKVIQMVDLSCKYNEMIFEKLNFDIEAGDWLYLSGPSGSGKSSLIEIILGLRIPTEGEIIVDGISSRTQLLRSDFSSVAFIKSEVFLFGASFEDYLSFYSFEISDRKIAKKLEELIVQLDLQCLNLNSNVDYGWIDRLSTGQKQRVQMVPVLLRSDLALLILDEAFSNIDHKMQTRVINLFKKSYKNLTVLITSHDPFLQNFCNKKYSMLDD